MLINFDSVAFGYGDNLIFSSVNFSVNEGERLALVGENGAGKTTLIKLMTGALSADEGVVTRRNGIRVGYLEQNGGYESGNTVYQEMRGVFKDELSAIEKLNSISSDLTTCEYGGREYVRLAAKLESLNKYVAATDAFNVDVRIRTVLNGMGFADFYNRQIDSMSGGEKTRLKLARLLLEAPDLLILDEPTNHLDINTLYWLEDYLQTFKGAVFVVSHDRYFLDKVSSRTLEIENGKLTSYAGSYTKYKQLKAEAYALALKEYERQQEEIKRLQTYIDKNIVRATTAKSAQSRVNRLERMEILEKPFTPPCPPRFKFTFSERPAEVVLKIEALNLRAGEKQLISDGQLQVMRGDKLAIVGENGAGKSTLLHSICANMPDPAIRVGRQVRFALYDQENANLNPDNTVLDELWSRHVAASQTEVRASLSRCGLYPEDMFKKVGELSGGERAKLALCVFENERGNVLVLDEPTNHLDLPARESLEEALRAFEGTVIFVSHDRYFISALAGRVAEIEGGKLTVYEGGYEGYIAEKGRQARIAAEREESARRAEYERQKEASYRSRKDRAEEAKKKAEIKRIEGEIAVKESREEQLNCLLSDPSVTGDYKKLNEVLTELQGIRAEIEELYAAYGQLL